MLLNSFFSSCGLENRKETHWIHCACPYFKAVVASHVWHKPPFCKPKGPGQVLVSTLQGARYIFIFRPKCMRDIIRSSFSLCNVLELRILYLLSCYSLGFSKACHQCWWMVPGDCSSRPEQSTPSPQLSHYSTFTSSVHFAQATF